MAYFPNGTAGDIFEEQWCSRCVHSPCCPVMELHMDWNREAVPARNGVEDETSEAKMQALDTLIPEEDGGPGQCRMFVLRVEAPTRTQQIMRDLREVVLADPARAGG